MKVSLYGEAVNYQVCVSLMDEEIRAELHNTIAPCTEQEFLDAYVAKHEEKYGTEFVMP